MIQDETGDRRAQNGGERQTDHEQRDRTCLFALGKPVGEIQDDSWEITGFSEAQKKARNV